MHGQARGEQALPDGDDVRVCLFCDARVTWRNGRWAHRAVDDARSCGRPPVPVAKGKEPNESCEQI
jgi:hypothetical protein